MKIGNVMHFNKRKKKRQKHNERKEKKMSSCKSPVYLALQCNAIEHIINLNHDGLIPIPYIQCQTPICIIIIL